MSNPFEPPDRPSPAETSDSPRSDRLGPWRDGDIVIAKHRVVWPRRCIECNASVPSAERQITKRLSWVPRWTLVTVLFGLVPYFLAAYLTRQHGTVVFSLCDRHAARRQVRRVVQVLILTGAIVGGLAAWAMLEQVGGLILAGVALIGLLVLPHDIVRASFVRGPRVEVRGAGPAFLASLPQYDDGLGLVAGLDDVELLD